MLSFGNSGKVDRSQFIGFRGIGRIAALPFCETLIFENKIEDTSNIDFCIWQGAKYRELLNSDATDDVTFEQTVRSIVETKQESCDVSKTHYFRVEIVNYSSEIDELLDQISFEAFMSNCSLIPRI